MSRRNQQWVFDVLLRGQGLDVLHPEGQGIFEQFGHYHADLVRVYSLAKAGVMIPKAWFTIAQEVERKAKWAEAQGFKSTARDLYLRATLLYGRAQYAFFRDDPRKTALHARMVKMYKKTISYLDTPVEPMRIPFGDQTIYATLHLPARARKVPCVLMVPGMDMIKEDWHTVIHQHVLPRGLAAIAMDGPGQGESRLHGLKVTLDNYEKAASTVIDYIVNRPEIDPEQIVLMGISMGSYWGVRIAAHEKRLKAAATGLACYTLTNQNTIFNVAQPSFKFNFMNMAGIYDEEIFDEQVTRRMGLKSIAPKVKCPIFFMAAEFDELTPLEETYGVYELVKVPKELWVFEDEFHPMANSMGELFSTMVDWLIVALKGKYRTGMDRRVWVGKDGTCQKGTGRPPWWSAKAV